jgi:hypothetical protein
MVLELILRYYGYQYTPFLQYVNYAGAVVTAGLLMREAGCDYRKKRHELIAIERKESERFNPDSGDVLYQVEKRKRENKDTLKMQVAASLTVGAYLWPVVLSAFWFRGVVGSIVLFYDQ